MYLMRHAAARTALPHFAPPHPALPRFAPSSPALWLGSTGLGWVRLSSQPGSAGLGWTRQRQ